jgi:hypothetical protein
MITHNSIVREEVFSLAVFLIILSHKIVNVNAKGALMF